MTAYDLVARYGARLIGAIVYDSDDRPLRIQGVRLVKDGYCASGTWVNVQSPNLHPYLLDWEECRLSPDTFLPPHLLDQIAQVRWARRVRR